MNLKENYYAIGTMQTKDGIIKGTVKYNPQWKKYQVNIDGELSGEFKTPQQAVDDLKRAGFKNVKIQQQENSTNLKENYERLFGPMKKENKLGLRLNENVEKFVLTEQQQNKFFVIQKKFQQQYPNHQLRLKEGFVLVNNLIVEKVETFIKKDNNSIIMTLKSFVKK